MADDVVRRLVSEQRRRMIAGVLGYVESQSWYRSLNEVQRKDLRDTFLGITTTYHEFILDVLKVSKDDVLRSDEGLELLREIHAALEGKRG